MRNALTLAAALGLLAAPAAHAENIVAGPNTTYLTTNPSMDQGEPLTLYSFDVPNHDVTATDKGADGKPLFSTPLIGFGEIGVRRGLAVPDHRAVRVLLQHPREHGRDAHRHGRRHARAAARARRARPTPSAPASR